MIVSQTILWKERKRFMSDGSIEETIHFNKSCSNQNGYEKLYLHIPFYVSDFQVITLWNLNKNTASQISGEEYMELIDSATAVKLLNRQITFFNDEIEDCDGYYYKSEGENFGCPGSILRLTKSSDFSNFANPFLTSHSSVNISKISITYKSISSEGSLFHLISPSLL